MTWRNRSDRTEYMRRMRNYWRIGSVSWKKTFRMWSHRRKSMVIRYYSRCSRSKALIRWIRNRMNRSDWNWLKRTIGYRGRWTKWKVCLFCCILFYLGVNDELIQENNLLNAQYLELSKMWGKLLKVDRQKNQKMIQKNGNVDFEKTMSLWQSKCVW